MFVYMWGIVVGVVWCVEVRICYFFMMDGEELLEGVGLDFGWGVCFIVVE